MIANLCLQSGCHHLCEVTKTEKCTTNQSYTKAQLALRDVTSLLVCATIHMDNNSRYNRPFTQFILC